MSAVVAVDPVPVRCSDVRKAEVRWMGGERGGDAGKPRLVATGDVHDDGLDEEDVGRNGREVVGAAGAAADEGGRAALNLQSACCTDAWDDDLECEGTYDLCFACDEDTDPWVASGGDAGGEGSCRDPLRDCEDVLRAGASKKGSMSGRELYVASGALCGGGTRERGGPWAADWPARSTLAKGKESAFEDGICSWGPWLRFEHFGDTLADPRACAAPPGPPRTEYVLALSISQITLSSSRRWWEVAA